MEVFPTGAPERNRACLSALSGYRTPLDDNGNSADQAQRLSRNQLFALFAVAFVTSLTFITIPRYPYFIDDALSEKAVLSYAHQHGFQFGKDIVFTYGPLGFLVSRYFFPHAAGARMAVDFLTCFATALGVSWLVWPLGLLWRCLVLAVLIFICSNVEPRADLVLYIGVYCWGLLCFLQAGRPLALSAGTFVCLAAFSVLVKANFLVLVGVTLTFIVLALLLRRKLKPGFWMAIGFILALLSAWLLAGQRVWNLKSFFSTLIPIIHGYDQTVGLEGLPALQQRGWITLPLIFATITIRALTAFSATETGICLRRFFLFLWTSSLLFIVWKHGFVRTGLFHSGFYFGLVPILVLGLEAVPCGRTKVRNFARGLGLLCCAICLLTLQSLFFQSPISSLLQPFRAIRANFLSLVDPGQYRRQMVQTQNTQLAVTALPRIREIVGRSAVDVFGQDQLYAVINDLNYRPRPIFQSYMAYNTALTQMNEQFYLSKAAPEFVLFRLTPIDRRYAPLEDSALLRHLLADYEPVEGENQFLLLKQKNGTGIPKLTQLRQGIIRPGEPILLNEGQTDLWLQIHVKPTLLGQSRQFLYKPPIVRLSMWRDPAKKAFSRFRAPTPMLAAGFVVSPMLANTEDALNLYTDCAVTRPYACSVELEAGSERFWQQNIHYRIYKIEGELGRSAREKLPQLLTYAGFQATPTEIISSSNAFVRVATQPAFLLPVGGSMRFIAPTTANTFEGKFGFGTSEPNVQPADFRVEEEMPDGTNRLLQSRVIDPGDYGLKPFSITLTADTNHKLILRTAPATNSAPDAETKIEKRLPFSCWADVRFN